MNRLQKKCILASVVLHGLLLLVVLFGAAFISKKPAPIPKDRINLIPSRLVDSALSGGGGNPNLARTDDRVKGDVLTPQPPAPVAPPAPKPPEPRRTEPRREPVKPAATKPADAPKPMPTKAPVNPKPQLDLVPTIRNDNTKLREKAEAAERAARAAAQKDASFRRELASKLGEATSGLKAGFESGTKVDVGGPGGEAYASYSAFVRDAYDDAWRVLANLASENHVVTVEVVIARDGHVVSQRFLSRSSNSAMNKSVQDALDRVKRSGLRPFPEGARDDERTFTIEFNLKAKRQIG